MIICSLASGRKWGISCKKPAARRQLPAARSEKPISESLNVETRSIDLLGLWIQIAVDSFGGCRRNSGKRIELIDAGFPDFFYTFEVL